MSYLWKRSGWYLGMMVNNPMSPSDKLTLRPLKFGPVTCFATGHYITGDVSKRIINTVKSISDVRTITFRMIKEYTRCFTTVITIHLGKFSNLFVRQKNIQISVPGIPFKISYIVIKVGLAFRKFLPSPSATTGLGISDTEISTPNKRFLPTGTKTTPTSSSRERILSSSKNCKPAIDVSRLLYYLTHINYNRIYRVLTSRSFYGIIIPS